MTGEYCDDCASAKERLNAFVDRELSEVEMLQVRAHLDNCIDCDECFEFHEHLKTLIRAKGCPEIAPTTLAARIIKQLR